MGEYAPYITLVIVVLVLVGAEAVFRRIKVALLPASEKAFLERAMRTMPAGGPTVEQRRAFKGCSNCGAASITLPYRDVSGRTYCSDDCLVWAVLGATEFCEHCLRQTTPAATGNMSRVNGIGRGFGGKSERCPRCRSVVRRVFFTFFYLPLLPLGRYRVIQSSPTQFWSRKLR